MVNTLPYTVDGFKAFIYATVSIDCGLWKIGKEKYIQKGIVNIFGMGRFPSIICTRVDDVFGEVVYPSVEEVG